MTLSSSAFQTSASNFGLLIAACFRFWYSFRRPRFLVDGPGMFTIGRKILTSRALGKSGVSSRVQEDSNECDRYCEGWIVILFVL